jgi:hypothetical protein
MVLQFLEGVDIGAVAQFRNSEASVRYASARLPVAHEVALRERCVETFTEGFNRPLLAELAAERRCMRDMMADLREHSAPLFELRTECLAVERDSQRAVSNPGPDQFDSLIGLGHPIGNVEFKERLRIVKVGHRRRSPDLPMHRSTSTTSPRLTTADDSQR